MIAARRVPRGTQKTKVASVAAPIGGWNARDAIGDMDKNDAVTLQNWWPGTSNVLLRRGFTEHATGLPGQVETLMAYSSGTTNTLFSAVSQWVYNVTAAGAVGAPVLSSLTNDRWQYVNFTNSGGSYLFMVNGADKMRGWNGTTWYADGDGSHDITGFDTSTATNITVFKNRLWFIQKNSLKAWYLGSQSISGAATSLDMSSVCQLGGYLVAAYEWTLDAGYGVDDYLVFITSNGETLVWRLTDPAAPTGIALIGLWSIGAPVGLRCGIKFGGDLLLITQDGVVPLAGELQSSRLNARVAVTDKIQYAMSTAITLYGANFGWQLLYYAKGNQLYLNVPVAEGSLQQQFVQNNITKAWCNFTGWTANCWEIFGDEPYFGAEGVVCRAWNGFTDAGDSVPGLALQAFQAYGGATQKQVKMVRYHLRTDGNPSIYGNVNVDFDTGDHSAQLTTSPIDAGLWDIGLWDQALWGSGLVNSAEWQGATGIGYSFAPFLKTATNGIQLEWTSTDMVFEVGGTL